jgi:hypothetical protein
MTVSLAEDIEPERLAKFNRFLQNAKVKGTAVAVPGMNEQR